MTFSGRPATTNIPPALQRTVHRCLEKSPEQRFQSASDLAFALEALSDSQATLLPGKAEHRPAKSGWRLAGLAAALIEVQTQTVGNKAVLRFVVVRELGQHLLLFVMWG